jgi:acid phosphatase type 7
MKHSFNLERPVLGVIDEEFLQSSTPFQPLPKPTGKAPFHLDVKTVLSPTEYAKISQSKRMVFHTVGDVGGVKSPADQQLVADHQEMQFDKTNTVNNPSFFYIIGDVVYYYGNKSEYNVQFYEPYKFYPAPIFAIPGNHDGDIDPTDVSKPKSLDAFMRLFCAKTPTIAPEAGDAVRTTMTQPNMYFTLVTPVANIIGLYTNVPEGGNVKADQQAWFVNELITAQKERKDKALIVTLHHPPFSMDPHHGASAAMQKLLADSFKQANVFPDIVLTGHVHNYQRFTQNIGKVQVPYIVAGAGGYWNLHNINTGGTVIKTPIASPFPNVTFEKYCEDRHGFMRITIDMAKKELFGEYFTVPRLQESWKAAPVLFDSFTIDLTQNRLK